MSRFAVEFWLPRPRDEVFAFFSRAENLQEITPPWLHFSILTPSPVLLQVGARIDYQLRLHGIPFRWQTEITRWEPPHAFTDIQRRGPYRKWEHTHRFTERDGGTWCEDEVHYAVPGGRLVDWLLVSGQVRGIFAYREQALRARLGGGTGKAVRG